MVEIPLNPGFVCILAALIAFAAPRVVRYVASMQKWLITQAIVALHFERKYDEARPPLTAGSLIGRGSGEAFQVAFSGQGFVIVQPSEGPPPAPKG